MLVTPTTPVKDRWKQHIQDRSHVQQKIHASILLHKKEHISYTNPTQSLYYYVKTVINLLITDKIYAEHGVSCMTVDSMSHVPLRRTRCHMSLILAGSVLPVKYMLTIT